MSVYCVCTPSVDTVSLPHRTLSVGFLECEWAAPLPFARMWKGPHQSRSFPQHLPLPLLLFGFGVGVGGALGALLEAGWCEPPVAVRP